MSVNPSAKSSVLEPIPYVVESTPFKGGHRQVFKEMTADELAFLRVKTDADRAGTDTVDAPSWTAVDVSAALDGDGPPMPTVFSREDGAHLFYAGKVHSVHGESESGKSWLVQCAVAQTLERGGSVLYADFEDDAASVAGRLLLLGVPKHVVVDPGRFVYVRPENSLKIPVEAAAFAQLIGRDFTLAVIDGVTDAMGLFGFSVKDNDDIAAFQREVPRAVARRTGAAVVCVDHVTKDADSRGRFAIGGQHKMAALDGAAFVVDVETVFAVGMAGVASVRVAKDRPGHVRNLGGAWRRADRTQLVAHLHLDSTNLDRTEWRLEAPENCRSASGGYLDRWSSSREANDGRVPPDVVHGAGQPVLGRDRRRE
ncbi:AAA family ATPase [Rhodococcus sp. NPDC058521]|uniref:AAA family ATPase n=1 Tax=Rhodococcus sp. NPDC058521 TaxID=3346536 RepID=UPI00365ECFD7